MLCQTDFAGGVGAAIERHARVAGIERSRSKCEPDSRRLDPAITTLRNNITDVDGGSVPDDLADKLARARDRRLQKDLLGSAAFDDPAVCHEHDL